MPINKFTLQRLIVFVLLFHNFETSRKYTKKNLIYAMVFNLQLSGSATGLLEYVYNRRNHE